MSELEHVRMSERERHKTLPEASGRAVGAVGTAVVVVVGLPEADHANALADLVHVYATSLSEAREQGESPSCAVTVARAHNPDVSPHVIKSQ